MKQTNDENSLIKSKVEKLGEIILEQLFPLAEGAEDVIEISEISNGYQIRVDIDFLGTTNLGLICLDFETQENGPNYFKNVYYSNRIKGFPGMSLTGGNTDNIESTFLKSGKTVRDALLDDSIVDEVISWLKDEILRMYLLDTLFNIKFFAQYSVLYFRDVDLMLTDKFELIPAIAAVPVKDGGEERNEKHPEISFQPKHVLTSESVARTPFILRRPNDDSLELFLETLDFNDNVMDTRTIPILSKPRLKDLSIGKTLVEIKNNMSSIGNNWTPFVTKIQTLLS